MYLTLHDAIELSIFKFEEDGEEWVKMKRSTLNTIIAHTAMSIIERQELVFDTTEVKEILNPTITCEGTFCNE